MPSNTEQQIVLDDILLGEVWIHAGQSNIAFKVNAILEVRSLLPFAKNIRSFQVG
ncbi:hypothetical protein Q4503_07480 [Colwellia sp. 6_MG-2023]|uniref:hypothetical protein n=1 Tax=Colwellia sp. 6_MG-2023 TaxID=3062676 RepID=UPI0026E427CA|nr:hypothetical protein [Colwellia sp. 6_MG-2023]MDO6487538.1 hypothetical protein [Colwellia sp. 6_MG-2023]